MITTMQRVSVNPEYAAAFEEKFRNRPRRVDTYPGFIRNEVLRPTQEGKPYIAMTHWQDQISFQAWDESRASHPHKNPLPAEAYLKDGDFEMHEVILNTAERPLTADTMPVGMVTAMNRISVNPEFAEQFEERFRTRAHLVDQMPGFIGNEVLRPTQEGKPYIILTYWASQQDFQNWTNSDSFKQGHSRSGSLPKDAFTGPSVVDIHEVILSSLHEEPKPTL